MTAYIVATVLTSDPIKMKQYAKTIEGLAEQYEGKYICKGGVDEVLEGDVPAGQRVVVLEFPDVAKAKAYVNDPTYLKGKAQREGAGTVEMRLLET